jgi:tRNA threonylcarbamoyladenosine modification (KEOPS) complex Cgi121 subunit
MLLDKDKRFNKEEMEIVKEKIFDHVMKKLYDKIYPKNPSQVDKLIYDNCIKLSWVEAKNIIVKAKNNNYDIFMDNLKQSFTNLDLEKSPKKKYQVVIEIFQTILKLKKFNDESDISADDNIEILAYIFIKIRPKQINTNIEFMKLFFGEMDIQLIHLTSVCNILKDFKCSHLIGINENEYRQKCQKVLDEINNKNNKEDNIINII